MGSRLGRFIRSLQRFSKRPAPRAASRLHYMPYEPDTLSDYTPPIPPDETPEGVMLPPPLIVATEEFVTKPISEYPIPVDVSEQLMLDEDKVFTITGVVQLSDSSPDAVNVDWDADDPFAMLNSDGTLRYAPRGSYFGNILLVMVEVADAEHPPSLESQEETTVYGGEPPVVLGDNEGEPVDSVVVVKTREDVIGNPDAEARYWNNQGMSPTCAITAVASIVESLMLVNPDGTPITYPEVLLWFTRVVEADPIDFMNDPDNYITTPVPGARPPRFTIDDSGNPAAALYEIVVSTTNPNHILTIRYNPDATIPEGRSPFAPTPDFVPQTPEGTYVEGWEVVNWMERELGIEHHMNKATDFTTLIQELEAGNKVLVPVDANELWNNVVLTQANEDIDADLPGVNTRENHVVWITGIDVSDPDDPKIIINDSAGQSGRSASYDLFEFFSAWEDAEYVYTATGSETPDNGLSARAEDLTTTVNRHLRDVTYLRDTVSVEERGNFSIEFGSIYKLLTLAEQPVKFIEVGARYPEIFEATVDVIEAASPGFRAEYRQYIDDLIVERDRIQMQYGIDPNFIEAIQASLLDE